MKITLVSSYLGSGGAERVVVLLADGFLKKGHQVSILTLCGKESDFYKLSDGVNRLALNIVKPLPTRFHYWCNFIYGLWVLRQAICSTKPDVVISFTDRTNVMTLLALLNTGYPIIVTEHCDPSAISVGNLWEWLRRWTYPYCDKVVSVSQGVDRYFEWLPADRRAIVNNPLALVDDDSIFNLPKGADATKKWIVAMGRLTHQKGFDILLRAFKKNFDRHLDWQLIIVGEGELRPELEKLKDSLGLNERALLVGLLGNPFPILKKAEFFVLSSRYEGFGNVIIEAMACGLPVIATDCPSGPSEIIRDGVDGIMVPNENVEELAIAMERLMSDEGERQRLAARTKEVTARFNVEKITLMWENLFAQVVKDKQ